MKKSLLSPFEFARCIAGIEAVDRLGKPAAEIGVRRVSTAERAALTAELKQVISRVKVERIFCYISGSDSAGWVTFGFYRFEWVRAALSFLEKEGGTLDERTRTWMQGLVFGYRPEAIENYLRVNSA